MFYNLIENLIRNINSSFGRKLRSFYYRRRLKFCGSPIYIDTGVYFESPKSISIGNNVWIDKNTILIAGKLNKKQVKYIGQRNNYEGEIIIGDNAHIGISTIIQGHGGVLIGNYFTSSPKCAIYSFSNDPYTCKYGTFNTGEPIGYVMSPVKIGNNVWLGLNVSVIGGKIQDNCFVKPNIVVTKQILANKIVGAKTMEQRFND